MRVLQFAKRCVVTVALVSVTLAGCGGESDPDAPFNPAGTTADMQAVDATFGSATFASFSTFSLMFDAALGGAPIISASAAALDIRGRSLPRAERGGTAGMRAAAVRSAQRLAAIMPSSIAPLPPAVAGKTFTFDLATGTYVASDRELLADNTVRFILYAVDPVTWEPAVPLVETGYVDLMNLSAGSTQAARVIVVSGTTTYLDYTVSASSDGSSGRVTVIGYVTDGSTQANITLQSTLTYNAGLTLTYSLDVPQRDISIDLTLNATDIGQPNGTIVVNLVMRGPNGTVAMNGQFTGTTGTLSVRVSGEAFATITTNGTTTTITRNDGQPLTPEESDALTRVFELQQDAFISFDQMLAPVGALFEPPA